MPTPPSTTSSARGGRIGSPGAALYDMTNEELDELLSEDGSEYEEEKPSLKNDAPTILRGQLVEPRFKTLSLRQLHDLIHLGDVDLDPIYQRQVVWPEVKQIGLIQSLFLNYYVPPVIFAIEERTDANGEVGEVRVCIDGKQRCTSILKFIEGRIPFRSQATGDMFWYQKFGHGQKGGRLLPKALRNRFDNIAMQVVEYDDLTLEKQRDIFQRVQLGVSLSSAEKLQAMGSPWQGWITELQKKYVTGVGTLGTLLPKFDLARGKPFQNLLAAVMVAYTDVRVTPASSNETAFLKRTDEPEKSFKRRVERALSMFIEIASCHYDLAFRSVEQRVAPVEFWFITLLIYTRMGCMSIVNLAAEIGAMRHSVRAEHVDIRGNAKLTTSFYDYLEDVRRTKLPGEIAASEEFEHEVSIRREERKRRREEERDGSYHGDGPTADALSGPTTGLRSAKIPRHSPHNNAAASAHYYPEPARQPIDMDALPYYPQHPGY